MLISSLKIKNYRGLDINIDTIEKVSIIIGQNDSGKTNICSAIMKVLDYNKRRIPFVLTDSTNSNKEDIEIEITLTADDLKVKYNISDKVAQQLSIEINEMLMQYIEDKEQSKENNTPYILDGFENESGKHK